MSERARQLPERLRVAAAAIADEAHAEAGQLPVSVDEIEANIQARAIAYARAALDAVADHEAAILADLQNPDAVGIEDIDRLAAVLDAGTIAFLVRDPSGRARAVLWARAAECELVTGEPAQALWAGLADAIRKLAEPESRP